MTWPWAVGVVVAACVGLLGAVLPREPASIPIAADLTHAGGARIVFARRLSDTTSPACGCMPQHGAPPGGWQGIVVPASRLTISRSYDGRATQYDIMNPDPGEWAAVPTHLGLDVRIGTALLPAKAHPTVRQLLAGMVGPHARPEAVTTDVFSLRSNAPLHVASLGREPIAALGAPAHTVAQLGYSVPARDPEDRTLTIRADFPASVSSRDNPTDAGPLIDVLGRRVLLWAPIDAGLIRTLALNAIPPQPWKPNGQGNKDAVSNFFVMPAVAPPVPPGRRAYVVVLVSRGAFSVRIVPRPAVHDLDTLAAGSTWTAPSTLFVTVPRVVSHADALVPVFRRAEQRPLTEIQGMPFTASDNMVSQRLHGMSPLQLWTRRAMSFQLPPSPPVSGVNVFGAMDDLRLQDARGNLTADGRPLSLAGRNDLELRHIEGSGVQDRHILVPVKVNAGTAQIYVTGRADTRLSGAPLATTRPWLVRVLSTDELTFVAAFAGTLFAAVGIARSRRAKHLPDTSRRA